jgi:hypothetical protein
MGCVVCSVPEQGGGAATTSRMWPSVRSCVDVSTCRCRGPHEARAASGSRELCCTCALFRAPLCSALGTRQRKLAVDRKVLLPHCFHSILIAFSKKRSA